MVDENLVMKVRRVVKMGEAVRDVEVGIGGIEEGMWIGFDFYGWVGGGGGE